MQPNLNKKIYETFYSYIFRFDNVNFHVFCRGKKIETNKALWHEEIRSTFCIPTITHDNNIFHIYSNIVLENLHITVRDTTGMILYSSTVTISNTQRYSFTIDNMNVGEFLIELTHENKYLYGYFNILQ